MRTHSSPEKRQLQSHVYLRAGPRLQALYHTTLHYYEVFGDIYMPRVNYPGLFLVEWKGCRRYNEAEAKA